MKTKVVSQSDPQSSSLALKVIRAGGVIALPTDTVYGIACAVKDHQAIRQLYEIKQRDKLKAIPVLVSDLEQAREIASDFNRQAEKLARQFWPGALTIIVPKKSNLPQELTAYETVGIRMPAHEWLLGLIRSSGPLAATSANLSGATSPATAAEVLEQLDGRIELIIDGGECRGGIPSTVVDCSQIELKILREGGLPSEQIFELLTQS